MTASGNHRGGRLRLEVIETAPSPWQAALLPVTGFPLPEFPLEQIGTFLRALDEVLVEQRGLRHEVLFQVWKLAPRTGADVISENVAEWSPDLGLGIWPDRRPPQSWTEELMVDAAAAVFRGDEPELPSYRLLRLAASEQKRIEAAGKMRGFGVQIEIFSNDTIAAIQQQAKSVFLPAIKERRFAREGFYLPLLDRRSIAAAGSADRLDEWLCGIDVYVRESAEDKGVLILSRLSIDALIGQVTQKLDRCHP